MKRSVGSDSGLNLKILDFHKKEFKKSLILTDIYQDEEQNKKNKHFVDKDCKIELDQIKSN